MLPVLMKILGSGNVVEKGMELIDSMHTSTDEEVAASQRPVQIYWRLTPHSNWLRDGWR